MGALWRPLGINSDEELMAGLLANDKRIKARARLQTAQAVELALGGGSLPDTLRDAGASARQVRRARIRELHDEARQRKERRWRLR